VPEDAAYGFEYVVAGGTIVKTVDTLFATTYLKASDSWQGEQPVLPTSSKFASPYACFAYAN
jgi:hypothetical protein